MILVVFPGVISRPKSVRRATQFGQPALIREQNFPLCGEPAKLIIGRASPENVAGTYNSVGSTKSGYSTCLDSAAKRDLLCSLSLPNRISLSRSTNAKITGEYPLVVREVVKRTLFFLAEHAGQRRDGINACVPRLRLESKSHILGVKINWRKLEKVSREHELQVHELVALSSMKMRTTDLNPTERVVVFSDSACYAFLTGSVERAGRNVDEANTYEFVK